MYPPNKVSSVVFPELCEGMTADEAGVIVAEPGFGVAEGCRSLSKTERFQAEPGNAACPSNSLYESRQ